MNTNLKNKENIQQAFDDLFSFKDEKGEIKHNAHMLMFRFLSEVERVAEEKNLKKKDLAKMIGTSPSYVTQLFRGDKLINMETLAKLEKGLGIEFVIKTKKISKEADAKLSNKPSSAKKKKKASEVTA
ncbi:helix-turn-helix transcriptional regulator [Catalinimonas sp. 4WD22]|uniref:helix-turn-helix domain-containing protein n=1 Tax=Catalinimonas locisalis TaxID=3133978 RepID=UPI003100E05E